MQINPSFDTGELRDLAEGNPFFKQFSSWENFMQFLPVLITAFVVLLFFFLLARFASNKLKKLIERKTNAQQVLVADFFGKVLWLFVFAIGVVLAMYVLGLGEISGSILGAAGITTFVVGFALKDIFENFLAGVIIAFDPPFVLGSWIKVNDIEGTVQSMTLRETMLKTFDGQDVYVPNAILLKNPLRNYTIDGFLRKEFVIGLDYGDDLHQGLELIEQALRKTEHVLTSKGREPVALIHEFATSTVNVKCQFWINTFDSKAPANKIKDRAMLNVLNVIVGAGHYLPADILEIKYYDPAADKQVEAEELKKTLEQFHQQKKTKPKQD